MYQQMNNLSVNELVRLILTNFGLTEATADAKAKSLVMSINKKNLTPVWLCSERYCFSFLGMVSALVYKLMDEDGEYAAKEFSPLSMIRLIDDKQTGNNLLSHVIESNEVGHRARLLLCSLLCMIREGTDYNIVVEFYSEGKLLRTVTTCMKGKEEGKYVHVKINNKSLHSSVDYISTSVGEKYEPADIDTYPTDAVLYDEDSYQIESSSSYRSYLYKAVAILRRLMDGMDDEDKGSDSYKSLDELFGSFTLGKYTEHPGVTMQRLAEVDVENLLIMACGSFD